MFKIGERVECIDASIHDSYTRRFMPCWVKHGAIYHIRGIHQDPKIPGYGVYLEEVVNPEQVWDNDKPREWSFNHTRFRPTLLKAVTRVAVAADHQ